MVDSERGGTLGQVGISAAFGLVIMVMIYATGHVSGAHINPAVTLSFVATRHFSARDALGYVPAQLVGAVAGALLLRLAWEGTPADLGATVPSVGVGSAFVYEFILTALLMFVIMAWRPIRVPSARLRRSRSAEPSRWMHCSAAP